MTKANLIEVIAKQAGITRVKGEEVVSAIFDGMINALVQGGRIEIRGFGTFSIKSYGAYEGRNPRTGEVIAVKEKRLPFFKVGRELKNKVNHA